MSDAPLRYGKPAVQRRLARSHASGTLCNPARRRFEVLRRELPELDRLARDWDEYLQPLADAVPELPPRAAVWGRIEAAIAPKPSPRTTNLWGRLAFLRGLALVSTASAFALALFLTFSGPAPPPSLDLDYVGVLSDARGQPRFVMTVSEATKMLEIRGVGRDPLPTDVSYQLWAISRTDGAARSLGLIDPAAHTQKSLREAEWRLMMDAREALVTAEMPGGSPIGEPSDNVISRGLCIRLSDG